MNKPCKTSGSACPFESSVGTKILVAFTGLGLILFLIAHLLGNLQIFFGREALNAYAKALKSLPEVLWGMRIGLLSVFAAHIALALKLAARNRAARPQGYQHEATVQATFSSRTMVVSGCLILAYLLYHLAHFTLGWAHPAYAAKPDAEGHADVYTMVVLSFQNPWISAAYFAAMTVLYFHLKQAAAAFPQSLGLSDERRLKFFRRAGDAVALVIYLGYISIPAAALAGWLKV